MKILIAAGDQKVTRFLTRALMEEGLVVDRAHEGSVALMQVGSGIYDVVVVDQALPGMDGPTLCRQLRREGCEVLIMMITEFAEARERVMALDAGADDAVGKLVDVAEFSARIRALTRRSSKINRDRCGAIEIDRMRRRALLDAKPLSLSTRELAVLTCLIRNAGRVVTRGDLIAQVWELSSDPVSNLVDVHVSRLREKLGTSGSMIETVRGQGYRLKADKPLP